MIPTLSRTRPCLLCQKSITAEAHPILGGPVCSRCLIQHKSFVANRSIAGESDGLPMFSIEFEVHSREAARGADHALILLKHGYLRAYDCTVDDEYKSPIYQSLAALQEALPTLEGLKDLVDDHCGTHIHVDCPMYDLVLVSFFPLFSPLTRYLDAHREETRRFWGRWPYEFLSVSSRYGTLQFRLPRYKSAEQYLRVVRFCRLVTHRLNDSFSVHSPSLPSPERLGAEILALYQRMEASEMVEERIKSYV
jgi:hypothetical protein